MFEISLKPQVGAEGTLSVSVTGDVITICGDDLDLSAMEDGDLLEYGTIDSAWVATKVTKDVGVIRIGLLFPCLRGAPEAALFPELILVTADGPVTLPPNGP